MIFTHQPLFAIIKRVSARLSERSFPSVSCFIWLKKWKGDHKNMLTLSYVRRKTKLSEIVKKSKKWLVTELYNQTHSFCILVIYFIPLLGRWNCGRVTFFKCWKKKFNSTFSLFRIYQTLIVIVCLNRAKNNAKNRGIENNKKIGNSKLAWR
jgi:hypothetical protein